MASVSGGGWGALVGERLGARLASSRGKRMRGACAASPHQQPTCALASSADPDAPAGAPMRSLPSAGVGCFEIPTAQGQHYVSDHARREASGSPPLQVPHAFITEYERRRTEAAQRGSSPADRKRELSWQVRCGAGRGCSRGAGNGDEW